MTNRTTLRMRFALARTYFRCRNLLRTEMGFPTYTRGTTEMIRTRTDPVRHATIALAIERIQKERIPGAFAEVGVFRGTLSAFLHKQAPYRRLFLFDTFAGFPDRDHDLRFRNTSVDLVKTRIGNLDNVEFRIGIFPQTAAGLESETFSLVCFDADTYQAAVDSLAFFYPRIPKGGYCFMHDYNSPDYERGVQRATDAFLQDRPEKPIELPDVWGSVVFRKA